MSLHRVRFDRSQVGDMSGEYVQAADAMDVIETLAEALEFYLSEDELAEGHGYGVGRDAQEKAEAALANYRRMKA